MATFLCHIHFWTLKALSPGTASGSDIGKHVYHDKRRDKHDHRDTMEVCRTEWAEGRGLTWTPHNKKPDKLREAIREYEEMMSAHRAVAVSWKTHRHCLLLLENGILITFVLSKCSGEVERILIDRSLVPRLQTTMDTAMFSGSHIFLTLSENPRPGIVSLSHRRTSAAQVPLTLQKTDSGRRLDKLSAQDPKVLFSEQGGLPVGRAERVLRVSEGLVAVWWREEWTANTGYNLLLFTITNDALEFSCGAELNGDPVEMQFSNLKSNMLLSLEKTSDSTYQCYSYTCWDHRLTRSSSEDTISSQADVVACEWNKEESMVLLGCENTTLILHDCLSNRPDITAQAFFYPISLIRWHSGGGVVMVCGPRGELQSFDIALNPLTFQTLSDTPSPLLQIGSYFVSPVQLQLGEWGTQLDGETNDNFVLAFDRGPVVLVKIELGVLSRGQLGPAEIVAEYVRENTMSKAIKVLNQLSWTSQQNECFICLTLIMDHLLTQPLSRETEGQMLECLAFFQSESVTEDAHYSYKTRITHLTRRLCHLLIRHKKLMRAMEVAEVVGVCDLFMDVHFLAVDMNNVNVAELAKQKAEKTTRSDFITDVLQAAGLPQEPIHNSH
ncbi:WD repeat-containing and planar cell polarity effector protein fritz homolog [Halichondria panicea]|uniref:WD repeat-containing and planar cell polarity effector protein fritz homolog n=1 Tax=Halichondria panicea TaxID=6063 RepID=UPI00312B7FF0